MADPSRGHRFYLQLGREGAGTNYGTTATPTGLRLFGYNWKAKPILNPDEDESLDQQLSVREVYQGSRWWEWSFEMDLNYLGILKLLEMIMGSDSSPATPAVTGPDGNGIYTHTLKVGTNTPSYTGQVLEGGPGGVATVSRFDGLFMDKMEIVGRSSGNDQRLRIKCSGWARNRTTGIAATALTMVNPRAALYRHATIVDDGSADPATDLLLRGWKLEIVRPFDRERFPFSNSALFAGPILAGKFRPVMTFTHEWQTETQYANYLANADLTPEMEFTGPEQVGAAGFRSIKFTMNKARIIDLDPEVDKFGPLMVDTKMLGLYNVADLSSLIVTVKTDQATVALG